MNKQPLEILLESVVKCKRKGGMKTCFLDNYTARNKATCDYRTPLGHCELYRKVTEYMRK